MQHIRNIIFWTFLIFPALKELNQICWTLRSGLHEIQTMIEPFHMDWRTTMHANGQFSRNAYLCIIPGNLSENHLHAWLFSNPCGQVRKSIKSRGQICPLLLTRKRTFQHELESNHASKSILDNFPVIIHKSEFLENCRKSICMHGCSPIHLETS